MFKTNIKQAIVDYNHNHRKSGEDKMTQRKLAIMVIEDKAIEDAAKFSLMSWWVNGNRDIPARYAKKISKILKVSLDKLLCNE